MNEKKLWKQYFLKEESQWNNIKSPDFEANKKVRYKYLFVRICFSFAVVLCYLTFFITFDQNRNLGRFAGNFYKDLDIQYVTQSVLQEFRNKNIK